MDLQLSSYTNFSVLKSITIFASVIGVVQSLLWIGLTLTGILAYNCVIDYNSDSLNINSITMFTFNEIYFRGNCEPANYPKINFIPNPLRITVLDPTQILIWISVYLAVAVCWLLSSISLAIHVNQKNLRTTNIILYIWVFVTLAICAMDLSLGIIFGVDHTRFSNLGSQLDFSTVNHQYTTIISAQIASISLMIVAFRGFLLWIVNITLVAYLFKETFIINEAATSSDTSYIHEDFATDSHSVLSTRKPIQAYETKSPPIIFNPAFEDDNNQMVINRDTLERAARMSTDNLNERRLRSLENFQQYPQTQSITNFNEPPFPAPDYTPPMPRKSTQMQSVQIRNTRYQ